LEPVTLTISLLAASASIIKLAKDVVRSYFKKPETRTSITIERAAGGRVRIELDPTQEESIRAFLDEIKASKNAINVFKSEGGLGPESQFS
jgi:hypothetical protein